MFCIRYDNDKSTFTYLFTYLFTRLLGHASRSCQWSYASTRCDIRSTCWRWWRKKSTLISRFLLSLTCRHTWKRTSYAKNDLKVDIISWCEQFAQYMNSVAIIIIIIIIIIDNNNNIIIIAMVDNNNNNNRSCIVPCGLVARWPSG